MSNLPDPASFARNGSEHGHQVALFCKASQHLNEYPELRWMFAIPNGGERNVRVAANLRAEGVKAGVLDICLPVPRGEWHGLYIEMKRPASVGKPAGTVSDEQKEWIQALRGFGYGVAVCWTWETAWDTILAYLNWRK